MSKIILSNLELIELSNGVKLSCSLASGTEISELWFEIKGLSKEKIYTSTILRSLEGNLLDREVLKKARTLGFNLGLNFSAYSSAFARNFMFF